jgi:hypothetical protein
VTVVVRPSGSVIDVGLSARKWTVQALPRRAEDLRDRGAQPGMGVSDRELHR